MEQILEWAASVAPWLVGSMGVIIIIMKTLKSWIDGNDILKPYWFWIALVLSAVGSVVASIVTGHFAWTIDSLIVILGQFIMIFGGEYITHTVLFKKIEPKLIKLWPIFLAILKAIGKKS